MVRRQEECWKAISTSTSPAFVPSAFFTPHFALFLYPSPSLLHTASLAASPPGTGKVVGEGMGGEMLWEPAAASPLCSKRMVQNEETQSGSVWVLNVCNKQLFLLLQFL